MSNAEFVVLFIDNIYPFFLVLLINLVVMYYILRQNIHHVFDPSFFVYVTSSFANSVPWFLFFVNSISLERLCFFIMSESLFWGGFLIIGRKDKLSFDMSREQYKSGDLFRLYFVLFIFVVFVTIFNYSVAGIPILQESKFTIRQNPVTAMLGRILFIPNNFLILYSFHVILCKNEMLWKRFFVASCLLVLIIFSSLSGSKGFIVTYVFLYFGYMYYYRIDRISILSKEFIRIVRYKFHVSYVYLFIVFITPLPVIAIYYGSSGIGGMELLLFRFVASGDGYWQGYVNNVIDNIDNTALWFERVFSFILGPLGLISTNAKIPIGTLILNQINPGTIGLLEGANSRVPLFSWVCFGWGGLIMSFFMGCISKLVAFCKFLSVPHDIVGLTVLFSLYIISYRMVSDPTLFGAGLVDVTFGIVLFDIYSMAICQKRGLILFK